MANSMGDDSSFINEESDNNIYHRSDNTVTAKEQKSMFSASPSSVFNTKFTISVLKSKYVFHPSSN